MAKITQLPLAVGLDGSETIVMVKDNITRRAALGGLDGAAVAPHVSAAELARDQAAQLVMPENRFVAATVDAAVALGEGSTAAGVYFIAVGEAEGEAEVRLRTADGSSHIYTEITKAALSSALPGKGADLIGYAEGGSVAGILSAQNKDVLYSSRFPTLTAAIAHWMAVGGTLVINQDYLTETALFTTSQGTFQAGKSYFLTTAGARTIKYTGPATHQAFHRWFAAGPCTLTIDANITFDGNNLCGTCFFADFTGISGADRRNCLIRGVSAINARLNTQFALGANGLLVRGGFDTLHLDKCHARNVTRAAGAGLVASYGSCGIQYFGNPASTANARHILIENGSAANVGSEDSPTSSAYEDMDGLLVFQYAVGSDIIAGPVIRNMAFRQCAGRAIKRNAPKLGGLIENITIERSVRGKYTGANDIAVQDGAGIIRNVKIYYSGDANVVPSTPIVLAPSSAIDSRGGSVESVNIEDSSGAPLSHVVSIFSTVQDTNRRAYTFSHIAHTGTAMAFIRLGRNATTGDVNVTLDNIDVEITQAVGTEDDQQPFLKVHCYNFVNRGSPVPAKAQANGTMAIVNWGDWWGDEACRGVYRYVPVWRGNTGFKNGLRGPGGGCLDAPARGQSEVFGRTPLLPVSIAPGATHEFPPFGSYQSKGGDFIAQVRRRDIGVASFAVSANANDTALAAYAGAPPAGWSVLSTGAPSGGGSNIEVWKDLATQALRITNYSASAAVIELTFNP